MSYKTKTGEEVSGETNEFVFYFSLVTLCRRLNVTSICEVWFFGFGGLTHGERGARTYNGGLGVVPPAGSRGRAPGEVQGGEAENFPCFGV